MRLTGPRRFEQIDIPAPSADQLQDGQVLLRVVAGGICGTDIPYFLGRGTPYAHELIPHGPGPGFPLHEVVGEVISSRHARLSVGDRVVGWASRYDGLSEVVIAAGDELHGYEPGLLPSLAVLIQPLACVIYAVEQLSRVKGCTAAVLGQGSIGVLFSHVLAERGAIVEGVDLIDRLDIADRIGVRKVTTASASEWARMNPAMDAPQIVIEAIGHQTDSFAAAIEGVAPGGEVYSFGIPDQNSYPFGMADFMRKGIVLRGGLTRDRARVLGEADAYLARYPDLGDVLATDEYSFTEAQQAYERAEALVPGRLKVVLVAG